MKIKYFIEAVKTDPDIIKCSVTLKGIRASIEPMVKKLTDTDEEYTTLMEIIPKFYRDHYHKDYEEMQCHTYEYTEYLYDEDDEPTNQKKRGRIHIKGPGRHREDKNAIGRRLRLRTQIPGNTARNT